MVKTKSKKNAPQKTVIIFGVSGFIGSNLAEFFSSDYKVIGTYHKNKVTIPNVLTFPCNVINKEEVSLLLFTFRPDIAIYCVGISSLLQCSEQEDLAKALNTVGLFNVTEGCQRYQCQICYISSNFVFQGQKKPYMEIDHPDANTVYGKTQSTVEFYIQKTGINYIIFRTCRIYGRGINPLRANWFEHLENSIIENNLVNCDDYIHLGLLDVHYLAIILKICFQQGITNRLLQVSSIDMITHYGFAKLYSEIFNQSDNLFQKGKWNFPFIDNASIPKGQGLHYNLNVSNLETLLSVEMPSIKESLEFTRERLSVPKCG